MNVPISKQKLFSGSSACPCINSTNAFKSSTDCKTLDGYPGRKSRDGIGICFPLHYGSSFCKPYDYYSHPSCVGKKKSAQPEFCHESFCYVDYEKCKISNELFFRSDLFDDKELFYSYSSCNAAAASWVEHVSTEGLQEINSLKVAIPVVLYPYHYKLSENGTVAGVSGPEYYNKSIPFQGALIDYIESIAKYSPDIKKIDYEFRSKGSDLDFPMSEFTSTVRDVQVGLAHMAVGPFWLTAERMQMTSFTTPVTIDKTYLVIPRPKFDHSLNFQIKKLIMPFEPKLWFSLLGTLLAVSMLAIWFASPKATNKRPWVAFRDDEWKQASCARRLFIFNRQLIESTLENGMQVAGRAVDHDYRSSLPRKLLACGFSFLILITASAYVASLAAYLTFHRLSDHIESMEEAIANNQRICAHPVLKSKLEATWPDATLYYSQKNTGYRGLLQDWDEGKCDILSMGWSEIQYDEPLMQEMCDRHLVFTKALVVDIPIAFPVRNDLAAGISHWLLDAETNNEVLFDKMFHKYKRKVHKCAVDITAYVASEESEHLSLTALDLTLPFGFLLVFAIIAVITKLCDRKNTLQAAKWISEAANLDENSARRIVDMINFAHLEIDDIMNYDGYNFLSADSEDEESTERSSSQRYHQSYRLSQLFNFSRDSMQHNIDDKQDENVQRFRDNLTSALCKNLRDNEKFHSLDDSLNAERLFGCSMQHMEENYTSKTMLTRRASCNRSRPISIPAKHTSMDDEELFGLINNAVERSVEKIVEKSVENVVQRSVWKMMKKVQEKR